MKKAKEQPTKKSKRAQILTQTEDQDSDLSFQEDDEEEIDSTEKEEDWIEYIKRSTKEAEEPMKKWRYLAGLKRTED